LFKFDLYIFFSDIKEWSFHYEAISSGIITMFIYGIQLFRSIKRYKEDIRQKYKNGKKQESEDDPVKAADYPDFVIRRLSVGVLICCHTIFLIIIILRITLTQLIYNKWLSSHLEWVYVFIISPLAFYGLQKISGKVGRKIFERYFLTNKKNLERAMSISMLSYFRMIYSKLSINIHN
jgi:hypothetical protein